MARALIVACGCRGSDLGRALLDEGWQVRGTTRASERAAGIEAAGIEAAVADPERAATILDQVADVTLIFWLLGSVRAEPEAVAAIHGPCLRRVLEEIVDTPVRGFVYEAEGEVEARFREGGAAIASEAAERWRIPVALVDAPPREPRAWREAMLAAARRLTS